MSNRKYTIEQFKEAVKTSYSIREALNKLDLIPAGGNYKIFHNFVKNNNIDTSHFTGQAWNRNKTTGPKRSIEDYLSNKQPIQSNKLKKRLLKEGIFTHKCAVCNNTKWMNKPIPLELDHINGNHQDNSLKNLRLICPNCHAQTPNYRGKNKSKA